MSRVKVTLTQFIQYDIRLITDMSGISLQIPNDRDAVHIVRNVV